MCSRPTVPFLFCLLGLASCRFRDLTPGSNRHDEQAVQAAAVAFYQAVAARSGDALDAATLTNATALIEAGTTSVLVPVRTIIQVPERRSEDGGARVVRSDLHVDGDIATDRVGVYARTRDGLHEYEATDLLTLARRDHGWRVAHAALGSWHTRSGP